MDGFAFALSNDGRFLYISETVSIYLGLSQVSPFNPSLSIGCFINCHFDFTILKSVIVIFISINSINREPNSREILIFVHPEKAPRICTPLQHIE